MRDESDDDIDWAMFDALANAITNYQTEIREEGYQNLRDQEYAQKEAKYNAIEAQQKEPHAASHVKQIAAQHWKEHETGHDFCKSLYQRGFIVCRSQEGDLALHHPAKGGRVYDLEKVTGVPAKLIEQRLSETKIPPLHKAPAMHEQRLQRVAELMDMPEKRKQLYANYVARDDAQREAKAKREARHLQPDHTEASKDSPKSKDPSLQYDTFDLDKAKESDEAKALHERWREERSHDKERDDKGL